MVKNTIPGIYYYLVYKEDRTPLLRKMVNKTLKRTIGRYRKG
jgi:hypothetical protein